MCTRIRWNDEGLPVAAAPACAASPGHLSLAGHARGELTPDGPAML
jgi:hypothetical protein